MVIEVGRSAMSEEIKRPTLLNRRILIVEDRYLVADDLSRICSRQGGDVVGLAGEIGRARRMAVDEILDLAILDVDLRGQDVFDVAAILESRGIPFLFVTGYRQMNLPERFRDRPIVAKPFSEADLMTGIEFLLRPPGCRDSAAS